MSMDADQYELSPFGLRRKLADIFTTNSRAIRPDILNVGAEMVRLAAVSGNRIIVVRAEPGSRRADHFFQELLMTVMRPEPGIQQVDYNYNQMGDGELRTRVLGETHNVAPWDIHSGGIERFAEEIAIEAEELTQNTRLEQALGVTNQPATPEEIAEAFSWLHGAVVLDA